MGNKSAEAKPRLDYRFIDLENLRVGDEVQFEWEGKMQTGKVNKRPSISSVMVAVKGGMTLDVARDDFRGVLLSKYQYRERCRTQS
jgi:hypothetical protein